ncbi:putative regulator [Nostocoides japonicum T1-X7]|uniref:Putative regulator n=1 Tax=Nostocoides japonicum T1-X7 TaxID=1194083 RepID=A0A077LTI1_9MICO|nr:hypothetical protein [Tetrasphaera japonica]CCH76536.1 putative regulator [Tetrasphaera japonica T1-X7]
MSARALTALDHDVESGFVRATERCLELTVVRRCVDLADLLSAAAAGAGDLAVVSASLRSLGREAVAELRGHGLRVLGVTRLGDEAQERLLRQLGIDAVVRSDAEPADIDEAVAAIPSIHDARAAGTDAPGDDAPDRPLGEDLPLGDAEPTRCRLVAVWGPLGSPGRTTVAVNLAAELAFSGHRTLLVDADTWGASIAQTLALVDEAPGLAAAARAADHGGLDRPTLARLAPEVRPDLRVLTGLPRADRWPELRVASVEEVLRLARTVADVVVVDTGFSLEDDEELSYDTAAPRRNAVTRLVLAEADELVVVGAGDPIGLQRLVRAVQDLGVVPSPVPAVVVNKVRASAVGSHPQRAIAEALARFSGLEDLTFLPWAPEVCDAALLAGQTLAEHNARSDLRLAIATLSERFVPEREPV